MMTMKEQEGQVEAGQVASLRIPCGNRHEEVKAGTSRQRAAWAQRGGWCGWRERSGAEVGR